MTEPTMRWTADAAAIFTKHFGLANAEMRGEAEGIARERLEKYGGYGRYVEKEDVERLWGMHGGEKKPRRKRWTKAQRTARTRAAAERGGFLRFQLRFPKTLHAQIATMAHDAQRSLHGEVMFLIVAGMRAEEIEPVYLMPKENHREHEQQQSG